MEKDDVIKVCSGCGKVIMSNVIVCSGCSGVNVSSM
jgi:hypothetical protein